MEKVRRNINRGTSEKYRGEWGWGRRDSTRREVIINLAITGVNTQREWGDIRQTTNVIHLSLTLSSSR